MSKRVAVYARVSTTRQAENDISIPDQLAQSKRYCEAKGWYVVREFVDAGASARDDKRPEFQRMIDAACVDPSPFDAILVHSQSRFFRDTTGYLVYKRKVEKHAVSLISMTQDFGDGPSADFAETILAAADQYTSAETAKHVTRTMLENARQGFWNGARAPFGYRTIAVEQRGQRIKKRLEVEPRSAEIVRKIFKLCLTGDGTKGPMGVKHIASWLNARLFKNATGNPFYTGEVHKILTREDYAGVHYHNRHDSRTRKERPRAEWIAVNVPPIVDPKDFARVQTRLHDRRPAVTAPRITNSEVLLGGLARCESCGASLMLRTGKSGRYRYYACASHRLKGSHACPDPIAVPEGQLDKLVLGALADQLLTPQRLVLLLNEAQRHRRAMVSGGLHRRSALRRQIKETERKIKNLYHALANGTVSDTPLFRETLGTFEAQRDESIRLLSQLSVESPAFRQSLSKAQASALAASLRRRLSEAPTPVQRRYVRALVSNIVVDREKAVISGPKAAIAAVVTAGDMTERSVLTSVREWRTGLVGEPTNALAGYLAAISRKLTAPLAIIVQSTSAAGKSALMEAVLKLVPEEDRVHYSAMTGQSLFYLGEKDLKHKILAIAEEEGVRQAAYALKLLQSQGELTIASTGKDPETGQMVTQEYHVEGPVMLFLTTTAIDIDEELLNRCLVLSIDESREQTRAIQQRQRSKRTLAGLLADAEATAITTLHRNAQRLLKPLAVVNPYADQLTFLDERTRTRRDQQKYLTLIDAIALLHQHQRAVKTIDAPGASTGTGAIAYIEVAPSDIALANRLAHEVLGRSIDELPPQTRAVLGGVCALVAEKMKAQGLPRTDIRFTRRELRERMGIGNTQIALHIERLLDMEYVLAHRGGRGSSFVYELLFDGAADEAGPRLPGLIAVETLAANRDTTARYRGLEGELPGSFRPHNGAVPGGSRSPESVENTNSEAAFDDSAVADAGNARRRTKANGTSSYTRTSSLAASSVSR